ncbi:hypothetical protein F2Q68_00015955 [Brassica cretica]|uniref:Uncharacterized protein n=1 Tax=Brassica cretica TaxID=69181 RepID=A0A8S9HBL2_BRACR|nr:hypothetical protein F2Q68_00015955 [Brassica cretica]
MPFCMLSSHARRHLHVHLPFSKSGVHASRYTGLCMSVRMRRSQVLRHLVFLCVKLPGTASCTSTPTSCVDTQQVSSWKGNDITSWEGKCDSAHHKSHTDLKLLSFTDDSSPVVSPTCVQLEPYSNKVHLNLEKTGDRKYSENLVSTIEEHRPCHFRSSMIGSVTAKEPFPAPTRSLATREARRKA